MFNRLFWKHKKYSSKTGFFKVGEKELIPINKLEKGSINDCIETIGYPINHIYTIHSFESDKISVLGFKALTRSPELVLAESSQTKVSYADVIKATNQIDWDFKYSDLNVEDILQEGIEYENFDLSFVKSILDLTKKDHYLYESKKYGLYLQFENEMLKAFTSTDWGSSTTNWLKDINQERVDNMIKEAKHFHRNEMEAMEEVNKQSNAFMNVPYAMKNEFLSLHKNKNGNFNFYNLVIAHYTQDCHQDEFLFMNKGRFQKIDERTYEVGNYIYEFDEDKQLVDVYEK